MLPEYDEATTSVCGPQYSGSSGLRLTSTGTPSRSRKTERTTSPATADPPIPQNATAVTPSAEGSVCLPGIVVGLAAVPGQVRDGAEHVRRVGRAEGADVVEVDHFAPGFSASSISITGMPSRTG